MEADGWKKAGVKNLKVSMALLFAGMMTVRLVFSLLFLFLPKVLDSARSLMACLIWITVLVPPVILFVSYRRTADNQQKKYYANPGKAPVLVAFLVIVGLVISTGIWVFLFAILMALCRVESTLLTMRLWWGAVITCLFLDYVLVVMLSHALPPDKIANRRVK